MQEHCLRRYEIRDIYPQENELRRCEAKEYVKNECKHVFAKIINSLLKETSVAL